MSIRFDFSSAFKDIDDIQTDTRSNFLQQHHVDELKEQFEQSVQRLRTDRASGTLPFFDLPFEDESIAHMKNLSDQFKPKFDNIVLLGIGGSALGAMALHEGLNHGQHNLLPRDKRNGCRFFCLDNVDPGMIASVLDVIDPKDTLVNVVSKSGGTAETIAEFMFMREWLKNELREEWREHIVVSTGLNNGYLHNLAIQEKVETLDINENVGGRFSVLSSVGLFPAAMTGIDISEVCAGARGVSASCLSDDFTQNPAAMLAATLVQADRKLHKPIHVFMGYSNKLYRITDWFRQLWAESLGKKRNMQGKIVHSGPTPVRALGATDQHSQTQLYVEGPQDKVVVFIGTRDFQNDLVISEESLGSSHTDYLAGKSFGTLLNAERHATEYSLTQASRMNLTIELDQVDARHLGALMYILETSVLYAGAFYNVNPLDQPGVEAGKVATYALMDKQGYGNLAREIREASQQSLQGIDIDF